MKQTILHENSHGVKIIRIDYAKRSKVVVRNGAEGFIHRIYRFNNIPETFNSPYISWSNLDCCNGWIYDKEYLNTAVQQGKKLYAGLWGVHFDENMLPENVIAGDELNSSHPENTFICRTGKLIDYYELDQVFEFYAKLGYPLSDEVTKQIRELCNHEIFEFRDRKALFNYADAYTDAELITTGLLLGYPLESTCSLLTRH